jgi:hypothetical protein
MNMAAIRKITYRSGLCAAVLLVHVLNAHSQWNDNPAINTIVCNTTGTNQFRPQLAPDESGGIYFAWVETDGVTTSTIHAQHLSAAGTRSWAVGGINVSGTGAIFTDPQIVADGNGGAIVSWATIVAGAVRHYMQKINSGGQLQWAPGGVLVCPSTVTPLPHYQLIRDNQGGAILLWDDTRAGNNQVYAQRIDANGNPVWPVDGLPASIDFATFLDFDAVADSTGGFFLCYSRNTGGLNGNDILAQHIAANGTLAWGPIGFILSGVPRDQLEPRIAKDSLDNVIIVWQDFRQDPVRSQLYGQRISAEGDLKWGLLGKMLVDSIVPASAWHKIATDTSRGVIITWLDEYVPVQSTTAHLFGKRIDSTGSTVWERTELASWSDLQTPQEYELASDYRRGAYISWLSPFSAGSQMDHNDLFAQHVLPAGTTEFALSGKVVSSAPFNKVLQQLTCDSNGLAVITWCDARNMADYDLYAARMVAGSTLPVNWLNFSGIASGNAVLLSWQTANEVNNKGFTVQRSKNGVRFDSIGFVAASLHYNYSFADNDPGAGSNYYHLQQQDIDGKFSYSRTIRIDFSVGSKLRVYPNPAFTFIIVSGLSAGSVVQLYSVDGKKLKYWRSSGSILEIDTRSMPKGVFFLRVMDHAAKSQTLPVILR